MAKIKDFLNKYDTILFDMDGVVTSENAYWTCAAITAYQMLMSDEYYGFEKIDYSYLHTNVAKIRQMVFCDDKLISILKNKGINSNWDLAYVIIAGGIICDTHDFNYICEHASTYSDDIFELYDQISKKLSQKLGKDAQYCGRYGELWRQVQELFQKNYVGVDGVGGIMQYEQPLFGVDCTRHIMSVLKQSGKTLGIGTGRPKFEIEMPLKKWNMLDLFDKNRIITYDDVEEGERQIANSKFGTLLTKPHPFVFLKGAYGCDYPIEKLLCGDFDKEILKKTLVVGDAGADMFAARNGKMDFLAVLTGVMGEGARAYFEEQKANYILSSICDMIEDE